MSREKKKIIEKEVQLGKYTFKKDLVFLLTFLISTVLLEVLNYLFLGFGFFPKYILFNLSYLVFTTLLIYSIPSFKTKMIIILILLTIQTVLNITNATLFSLFGDLFSFDMLSVGAEAVIALNLSVFNWWAFLTFVALLTFVYIFIIMYNKATPIENIQLNRRTSLMISFLMMFSILCGTGLNRLAFFSISNKVDVAYADEEEIATDQDLYNDLKFKVPAFKKFGTFGFYIKNISNVLTIESGAVKTERINATIDYLTKSKYAKIIDSGEYFGVSKGNNVISILLESVDCLGIDPYTTPTLYALISNDDLYDDSLVNTDNEVINMIKDNTVYLSEFYGRNKTNYAESISIVGSFAKETQFSRNCRPIDISKNYNFDYSLPNMLRASRNDKILTTYLHGNKSNFYGRSGYLDMFGFKKTYFTDTMDDIGGKIPYFFSDFIVEENLVNAQKDNLIPVLPDGQTFYTQYSTITCHGSYVSERDRIKKLGYYDIIEEDWEKLSNFIDETYNGYYSFHNVDQDLVVHYKGAMIDLDRALYSLFENLREKGLQDSTTVVLYSDHYVYYNSLGASARGLSGADFSNTSLYNIPCFIFDSKLSEKLKENGESLEYDKFTSVHNIVPTMLDILGIKYNQAYYTGYSIFNSLADKTGYVSIMNGILDNNFFTFDVENVVYKRDGATDEDLERYRENAYIFLEKQKYIEYLYKYNVNQYIK